jgi:hypothetical protein
LEEMDVLILIPKVEFIEKILFKADLERIFYAKVLRLFNEYPKKVYP